MSLYGLYKAAYHLLGGPEACNLLLLGLLLGIVIGAHYFGLLGFPGCWQPKTTKNSFFERNRCLTGACGHNEAERKGNG